MRRKIYTIWCAFAVLSIFLGLFPFFWLFLQHHKIHSWAHFLNRVWAHLAFIACGLFWTNQNKIKFETPVVYCANHTSFADIPLLFLGISEPFTIIGKSSLVNVPLFGYMFRRLYIAVNRGNRKSRAETLKQSFEAIDQGKSLALFPEGGIPDGNTPNMISFKDGAFRIAIEKQIPIVPITIPYNWIILKDEKPMLAKWHKVKAIYHEPISTKGMTLEDIPQLKQQTFDTINTELKKHQVI
ncbi:MAG: 1-acyl-sn-glycerol-3-phosphate acyltransferase [Cytophagales bacterium]|nr:1-acyl-sn-glycerol-3-phosphate acyltransferase [Cytophagales bacterium]